MTLRTSVGAAVALAFCTFGSNALGQDQDQDPVVIAIQGPCVLALNGEPVACGGLVYMAFPASHRINFTVITEQAGWTFSGLQDANDGGRYALALDSVVTPRAGLTEARGECVMAVADDGVTVSSIACVARTRAGVMMLKASGVAQVGTDDDDEDDGDDPPEPIKG
jgi:hypothetical protein